MNKFFNFFLGVFRKVQLFQNGNTYGQYESQEVADVANTFINRVRPYTMLPVPRLISLYTQVKYCEQHNIRGDYMECGVWKGGAVGLMALTNQLYGTKRRNLYLFDSFNDICPPDPELDGQRAIRDALKYSHTTGEQIFGRKKFKSLKGFYDSFGGKGTLHQTKKLLFSQIGYDKHKVQFYKGWFEDTIPKASKYVKQLAILRIDADWYKSVYISLKYFYPKVVKGGFIIIDDYGYYEGCTKAVKKYFSEHNIRLYPNYIDSGCVYFIK